MCRRLLRLPPPLSPAGTNGIRTGIFCDCLGTLYSPRWGKNDLLVAYLNEKFRRGHEITLISGDVNSSRPEISHIGLHPDIVRTLTTKKTFAGSKLELLIDNDPPELFECSIYRDPADPAFNLIMKKYLRENGVTPPAPHP